jgi:hypothetical protein
VVEHADGHLDQDAIKPEDLVRRQDLVRDLHEVAEALGRADPAACRGIGARIAEGLESDFHDDCLLHRPSAWPPLRYHGDDRPSNGKVTTPHVPMTSARTGMER